MPILQIDCLSGTGTHLIENLLDAAGYERFDATILPLCQAVVETERDPGSLSCVRGFVGEPASAALAARLEAIGESELPEDLTDRLAHRVAAMDAEKVTIVNYDDLLAERYNELPDGRIAAWRYEDVRALRKLVAEIVKRSGRGCHRVAVTRNPVDIYLSKRERGGLDEHLEARIHSYFQLIADESLATVKYEEICAAADPQPALRALGFDDDDLTRLDSGIIHGGEVAKWQRYPRAEVEEIAKRFSDEMAIAGYDLAPAGFGERMAARLRRLAAEISVINRMANGDYRVSGAYNWHRRSILGRVWFRLVLLNPKWRRNVANWHHSIGQDPPF